MASCYGVAVMTAAPKNSARFHARLAALYRAGTYCDTKIVCKGQNFPVMKNMMCLQSDVFERILSGKSKVRLTSRVPKPQHHMYLQTP